MAAVSTGCYVASKKGFAMTFHVRLNETGAAELPEAMTKALGLSFGDRACLALGRWLSLAILTADRRMAQAEVGLDIRLIR